MKSLSSMAMAGDIEVRGFSTVRGLLSAPQRQKLSMLLGSLDRAGRRGLLGLPGIAELARSAELLRCVRPHVPLEPVPVRCIYFDKSPDVNWFVAWHQDLTLALRWRVDVLGFGPWSVKDGIPHALAPIELLQQMLTVRLHLDDADESNGALRVVPGSHRLGRLSPEQMDALRRQQGDLVCRASAGDALLMRPLLAHASSRSNSRCRRRVLHIEYAGFTLPDGLQWHEAA